MTEPTPSASPSESTDPRGDLALKLRELEDFIARAETTGEDLPPEVVQVTAHLREIIQALDGLAKEMGG